MNKYNSYTEKELFTRIAKGDTIAFRKLFDTYYPILRLNAIKLLKSEYWAEEVVQEALLHIWETKDNLHNIENPLAWLFRIVANKCFDRVRHQDVELRAQYFINRMMDEKQNIHPTDNYDYELLRKLIREAVDRLPEQQKLVYNLQQQEELSYKEIAQRLNISPHTVRNHLIRAFHAIRTYLINHGEFLTILPFLPFF